MLKKKKTKWRAWFSELSASSIPSESRKALAVFLFFFFSGQSGRLHGCHDDYRASLHLCGCEREAQGRGERADMETDGHTQQTITEEKKNLKGRVFFKCKWVHFITSAVCFFRGCQDILSARCLHANLRPVLKTEPPVGNSTVVSGGMSSDSPD